MDANIKMAASCLRRAAYDMQSRINEIHGNESREKNQEDHEDMSIGEDLRQDEFTIALNASHNKDDDKAARDNIKLAEQDRKLRKKRDQLKSSLKQHTADEETEIRSLQNQISKLNGIASTLEYWHD